LKIEKPEKGEDENGEPGEKGLEEPGRMGRLFSPDRYVFEEQVFEGVVGLGNNGFEK